MPSSVIQSIAYELEHSRLTVTFTSGRVYEYYMVPPSVAAAFRSAFSKGTFFNLEIRDCYACREVTPSS
ncbi:MAG TPA: KTSC domain-containing protein [Pseudolabrys sp.]|nr:KTSC domain-containing protein [Pseudolabrys sp.]